MLKSSRRTGSVRVGMLLPDMGCLMVFGGRISREQSEMVDLDAFACLVGLEENRYLAGRIFEIVTVRGSVRHLREWIS